MSGFQKYDAWKLASPDDEAEEAERKRKRRQSLEDLADDEYDRKKDERCPPHYCDNQGLCHYCGIVMEPDWLEGEIDNA